MDGLMDGYIQKLFSFIYVPDGTSQCMFFLFISEWLEIVFFV